MRLLIGIAAIVVTALGLAAIASQAFSGQQPWDGELSDAMIFAKSIPFMLGLGVLIASLRDYAANSAPQSTANRLRRFAPGTVCGHWVAATGFFIAMVTGSWQYLGGVLEVEAPIPLYLFYRAHFVGATLLLFSIAYFLTSWRLGRNRELLVPRGQWRRHLRGMAHELPKMMRTIVAEVFGLDMKRTPPPAQKFTFYEKTFSFPTWAVGLTLITVTGLIKALRYVYPVPGGVLYWSSTLHVAAMVLLGIKLLDHMRYTVARWPLMASMGNGWMSRRYAAAHHPAWAAELQQSADQTHGATTASATAGAQPGGAE